MYELLLSFALLTAMLGIAIIFMMFISVFIATIFTLISNLLARGKKEAPKAKKTHR